MGRDKSVHIKSTRFTRSFCGQEFFQIKNKLSLLISKKLLEFEVLFAAIYYQ
jgi:hypothetical protein